MKEEEVLPKTNLDRLIFISERLGMPTTPKQEKIFLSERKLINITMTGNQFGKSTFIGLDHLSDTLTKAKLAERGVNRDIWTRTRYETLVLAPQYEVVRGVFNICLDILNGTYVIKNPDEDSKFTFNIPNLGGLIVKPRISPVPEIHFPQINASIYFRSADELGASFKMRKLAKVSADEAGDIQDLIPLVDTVLKPRTAFWGGSINLYGTPQESMDLYTIAERAEKGDKDISIYRGSMYDNIFLPVANIKRLDESLDPVSRKRVIYGEQVTLGERYFPPSAIARTFSIEKTADSEGFLEPISPEGKYIISADFAASKDRTAIAIFRYDQYLYDKPEPIRPVYWKYFVGNAMPVDQQYELIKKLHQDMRLRSAFVNLIIDATSLGGKNAEQALFSCHPYPWHQVAGQTKPKMEALGATRQLMELGRKVLVEEGGNQYRDDSEEWGLIRIHNDYQIRKEFMFYKLDDRAIENDNVMVVAMICWWLKFFCPYRNKVQVLNFDPLLF